MRDHQGSIQYILDFLNVHIVNVEVDQCPNFTFRIKSNDEYVEVQFSRDLMDDFEEAIRSMMAGELPYKEREKREVGNGKA